MAKANIKNAFDELIDTWGKTSVKVTKPTSTTSNKNTNSYATTNRQINVTKIRKATGNTGTSAKNTGSRQQNEGTEIRKTNTGAAAKNTNIPNTTPTSTTTNVYKKGGTVATLGLGAVLGGVGTWLSGITQEISTAITPEDLSTPEAQEEILDETAYGGTWWDDMNEEAANLLEGAADIPVLGDVTTAAEEGSWSLPLLIGIVVLVIGVAFLIYKKAINKNKKPAAKKHRKAPAKKHRSTKK